MVNQERIPPYVSYKTWQTLLEAFKRFVPDRIDSSYFLGELFSGSSAKKLRTTLLFLGLIDYDSIPTLKLQRLSRSLQGTSQEKQSKVLRDIVETAYSFLFTDDFNLERATSGQLSERFERLGVRGNTLRQCISFFLHIARDAEIELSPRFSTRSKLGVGRKNDLLKTREKKQNENMVEYINSVSKDDSIDISELNPSLAGLLKDLIKNGSKWDKKKIENFKTAFIAIIDIVYPETN